MAFKDRVLNVVRKIKKGKFLTYKEVAKLAGNEKAYRVVGNILGNMFPSARAPEATQPRLGIRQSPSAGTSLGKQVYYKKRAGSVSEIRVGNGCMSEPKRKRKPDWRIERTDPRAFSKPADTEIINYIPCHRVIKNNYTVGGYFGSYKNSWKKLALLLKEGVIAVMPTDTIYGICGSALNKQTVEKIYKLRRRSPQKPMIILISDFDDLKIFGVDANYRERYADFNKFKINKSLDKPKFNNVTYSLRSVCGSLHKFLKKIWPGPISVILNITDKNKIKKFKYLHRGTKTLAFRLPKPKWLRNILKISGPLVAPSANWEGYEPAKTISEAKKYFGNKVVYYDGRGLTRIKRGLTRKSLPSTLIKLKNGKIEIIRQGGFKIKIK